MVWFEQDTLYHLLCAGSTQEKSHIDLQIVFWEVKHQIKQIQIFFSFSDIAHSSGHTEPLSLTFSDLANSSVGGLQNFNISF